MFELENPYKIIFDGSAKFIAEKMQQYLKIKNVYHVLGHPNIIGPMAWTTRLAKL